MASHGFTVSVCNRSPAKVDATVDRAAAEGDLPLKGYKEPKEFIESLSKPRKVILLVQAGAPVDATIAVLSEFMEVTILRCNCYTIDTRVVVVHYDRVLCYSTVGGRMCRLDTLAHKHILVFGTQNKSSIRTFLFLVHRTKVS